MKTVFSGVNDAGQRLDKFLIKYFKGIPQGTIHKWLRKKRVRVNGKHVPIDYILQENDKLDLYINDEFFQEKSPVITGNSHIDIVYEDENILIANKPSGLACHSGGKNSDTLIDRAKSCLMKSGAFNPQTENSFSPALCNRIDRNTSGLVIIGKTAKGLRAVNEKIREGSIRKFYLLRAEGEITPKQGEIRGFIRKNEQENKVYFCSPDADGTKEAVTLYRVLGDGFVEAELITGRTHQIRASLAKIGHPLVGDVKYGATKNNKNSFQDLISYIIHFDFSPDGTVIDNLAGKTIELPIKKG